MAQGGSAIDAWRAFVAGGTTEPPALLRWPQTLGDEDRAVPWEAFRPNEDAVLACTCHARTATNGRHWLVLFEGSGKNEAVHLRLPTDRYEYLFLDPTTGEPGERRRLIVADSVHLRVPDFAGATLLWLRFVIDPPPREH